MTATGCTKVNLDNIITELKASPVSDNEKIILSYLLTLPDSSINSSIKSFIIGRIINENSTINIDSNLTQHLRACTSNTKISNCDIMLLNLMKYAYAVGCIILGKINNNNPQLPGAPGFIINLNPADDITDVNNTITPILDVPNNINEILTNAFFINDTFYSTKFIDASNGKEIAQDTLIGAYKLKGTSKENTLKIVNFQKLLKSMIDTYPKLNYQQKIKLQLLLFDNIYIGEFGQDSIYQLPYLKKIFRDMLGYKCVSKNVKDVYGLNNLQYLKELLTEYERKTTDQDKQTVFDDDLKTTIQKCPYFTIDGTNNTFTINGTNINITDFQSFNANFAATKNALDVFINDKLSFKGGYNNKNGDIKYYLCKCNFKQTFKQVSAKSSREAAKMVANKVFKGNKKSVKFSLKRMVGKKEKCYDYEASLNKYGKIVIKNQ